MDSNKRTMLTMSQVMLPSQANVAGNVHGGEIMKFMDSTAGAVAVRYSQGNVVTARVDELQFHLPILVGDLVICTGRIAYVGNTSMEVVVTVEVENMESGEPSQIALTAYFTMVALDEMGKPKKIPQLTVETEQEKRLYEKGKRRHQERKNK